MPYTKYDTATLVSILENTLALDLDKDEYKERILLLRKLILSRVLLDSSIKVSPIILGVCPQPKTCPLQDTCFKLVCTNKKD